MCVCVCVCVTVHCVCVCVTVHCAIMYYLSQLMSAMIVKMGDQDDEPLPQETMDGCDSDEWSN